MATFGGQSGIGTSVETGEIEDGAVTDAKVNAAAAIARTKLADVTTSNRLLGRDTAGAGAEEEITIESALNFFASIAQGDILYRGAAGFERLAAGTSGLFLKTLGAGANPAWDSAGVEKIVFVPATAGQVYDGATFASSIGFMKAVFSDLAAESWAGNFRAPAPVNGLSISSIRVFYNSAVSARVVQLACSMSKLTNVAGTARVNDSTDTARDYATEESAAGDETGIITLNADVYNGIGACATGDVLGIRITRNGAAAADTYATDWDMLGVEITWA